MPALANVTCASDSHGKHPLLIVCYVPLNAHAYTTQCADLLILPVL
jgi:hypothetical protein